MNEIKPCECSSWARIIDRKYLTNHHEKCPRYNDSLMDAWKVSDGTIKFYTDDEQLAREEAQEAGVIVEKVKIHREVYENLPEFEGI